MQCQELEQVLEQWFPGSLSPEAAAHLEACQNCRALIADLEAIQEAAGRLGNEDRELAPPERVWLNLRAQLAAEGIISGEREPSWLATLWGSIPRPALAAAYLSLLLAAAALGGLWNSFRTTPGTPEQIAAVRAATANMDSQFNVVETGTVKSLPQTDVDLTATLRRNLDAVDNFIAVCEKSVREEPQNEMAREYLYSAYQQKAELLSTMMDRGTPGENQ
jgi:hypothetical protein